MLPFSSGERRQLACGIRQPAEHNFRRQAAGEMQAGSLRSPEQETQTFESVRPAEFYSADDAGRVAKAAG